MMHGDIPPNLRAENFDDFKNRNVNILIATDLASWGLDFPFVSHIINLDYPWTASDYLHRAGWAGRAGRPGFVISLYWNADLPMIKEMQKSHDEVKPVEIKGSAYSLINKEKLKEMNKNNPEWVNIGKRDLNDPLKKKSDDANNLVLKWYERDPSSKRSTGGSRP